MRSVSDPAMATGNAPTQRITILIVDDFDDSRQLYADFLTSCGFDVLEAADGVGAIAKALEHRPSVVVMDLSLPVLDGREATRRLKSDPRTGHIPIIALTGHTPTSSGPHKALETGFDRFLAKPCLPDDLLATVNEILAHAT
jgi:two-component system, cell cycle response regulator DivK